MQPIYASLSFALLPDICKDEELIEANALLDGTLRLMSFLAPGLTALLLLAIPMHYIYTLSSVMFFLSFLSLSRLPTTKKKDAPLWTRRFWWEEMKEGYRTFFEHRELIKLTMLSSTVQFAVGATMVLSVPFIRGELNGAYWEYALFAGAFPIGYAIGTLLIRKRLSSNRMMYIGLIGGGLSFFALYFVHAIPFAWACELFGGLLFPLFNAHSSALFQREAPRDRLSQLSAVRLLFLRGTMPLGILFASSTVLQLSTREIYMLAGVVIMVPGLVVFVFSKPQQRKRELSSHESRNIS